MAHGRMKGSVALTLVMGLLVVKDVNDLVQGRIDILTGCYRLASSVAACAMMAASHCVSDGHCHRTSLTMCGIGAGAYRLLLCSSESEPVQPALGS